MNRSDRYKQGNTRRIARVVISANRACGWCRRYAYDTDRMGVRLK
jgi:hypothetical protein